MRKRENKQNHRPILRRFTTWLHGAGAKCALIYAVGTLVLLVLFAAACAPPVSYTHLTLPTIA